MHFVKVVLGIALAWCAIATASAEQQRVDHVNQAALRAAECFRWPIGVVESMRIGRFEPEPKDGERNLTVVEAGIVQVNPDGSCDLYVGLTGQHVPFSDYQEHYIRDPDSGGLYMLQLQREVIGTGWVFMGGRYVSPLERGIVAPGFRL